jgi:hypothetical protein
MHRLFHLLLALLLFGGAGAALVGCDSAAPGLVEEPPGEELPPTEPPQTAYRFNLDWPKTPIAWFRTRTDGVSSNSQVNAAHMDLDFEDRTFVVQMSGPRTDGGGQDTLRLSGAFEQVESMATFRFDDGPTYYGLMTGDVERPERVAIDLYRHDDPYQSDFMWNVWVGGGEWQFEIADPDQRTPQRHAISGPHGLDVRMAAEGYPQTRPTCMSGLCRRVFVSDELIFQPGGAVRHEVTSYPEGKPDQVTTHLNTWEYAALDQAILLRGDGTLYLAEAQDSTSVRNGLRYSHQVYRVQ